MREAQLRQHAVCSFCNRRIGSTGLPLFWRVTIDRFGVDLGAVRRQDGLAQMLGSSALAAAMGPDPVMAKQVMDPVTLTACEDCAMTPVVLATALERAA